MRGFAIFCLLLHLVQLGYSYTGRRNSFNNNSTKLNSWINLNEPSIREDKSIVESPTMDSSDIETASQSVDLKSNDDIEKLDGEPESPETQSFVDANSQNLVNNFTGDFNYNIPLFEIDGYPINLAYQSGITMEQEASWVGLGWTLNPGAITRNVRGLPDDFKGDEIKYETYRKPNQTIGFIKGVSGEIIGFDFLSANAQDVINYNNYNGFSVSKSVGIGLQAKGFNFGANFSFSEDQGLSFNPSMSYGVGFVKAGKKETTGIVGFGLSASLNTRTGFGGVRGSSNISTQGIGEKRTEENKDKRVLSASNAEFGGALRWQRPYQKPFEPNTRNLNISGVLKLGSEVTGVYQSGSIGFTYSREYISNDGQSVHKPAFGYLNLDDVYSKSGENITIRQDAVLDFAKEKDQGLSEYLPNLTAPYLTFDNYNLNTQLFSSSFRSYKSGISVVYDPVAESLPAVDVNASAEVGAGNAVKVGAAVDGGTSFSYSGPIRKVHDQKYLIEGIAGLRFNETSTYPLFKSEGGFSTMKTEGVTMFNELGGTDPVSFLYMDGGSDISSKYKLSEKFDVVKSSSSLEKPDGSFKNRNRTDLFKFDNYSSCIIPLLLGEAKCIKWIQDIKFEFNNEQRNYFSFLPGYANDLKDHHIFAFESKDNSGMVYRFGIPVVNHNLIECSWTVEPDASEYERLYAPKGASTPPTELSRARDFDKGGYDKYFSKKETPAYITSHLLTSITSPDYADRYNDGFTPDDIGTYVKFDYVLKHNKFKYRSPNDDSYFLNSGRFNKRGYNSDDQVSITYGEKQLWYLKSLEGKSSYADFLIEDRNDLVGINPNGGNQIISSNGQDITIKASRLEEIKIYDKVFNTKTQLFEKATSPKKVILFRYSYTLQPKNTGPGKLTLCSLIVKDYTSKKGESRYYSFDYGKVIINGQPIVVNPGYDRLNVDRWGMPTEKDVHVNGFVLDPKVPFPSFHSNTKNSLITVNNTEYNSQDILAYSWNLTNIKMPSGAEIIVDYERDQYNYVQDVPAGELYTISGFERAQKEPGSNSVYLPVSDSFDPKRLYSVPISFDNLLANGDEACFIRLSLNQIYDGSISLTDFEETIINKFKKYDLNLLFYKALVEIGSGTSLVEIDNKLQAEWISGYASIIKESEPVVRVDEGKVFLSVPVRLERLNGENSDFINPITKSAFGVIKTELPHVYQISKGDPESGHIVNFIKALVAPGLEMYNSFLSLNKRFLLTGLAKNLASNNHSYVRLGLMEDYKFGGNSRVSKVSFKNTIFAPSSSGPSKNVIVKVYKYLDGVASSEPLVGAEDNLAKKPVFWERELIWVPDESVYQELPIIESLQPSPVIGYSKVEIEEFSSQYGNRNILGKAVYEFYTAKDFPTKVATTGLRRDKDDRIINTIFYKSFSNNFAASQGYSVSSNDMHGKPKSTSIYSAKNESKISGVDYFYKLKNGNLHNSSVLVDRDLKLSNSLPEFTSSENDWVIYNREEYTYSFNCNANFNLDAFVVGPLPLAIATLIPYISFARNNFKYVSFLKQNSYYGMLDSTVTYDMSNTVVSKNEAYDKVTGEPIVSSVTNSYKDKTYSVNFPAYWIYPRLSKSNSDQGRYFDDWKNPGISSNSRIAFPNIAGANFEFVSVGTSLKIPRAYGQNYSDCLARELIFNTLNGAGIFGLNSSDYPRSGVAKVFVASSGNLNILKPSAQSISLNKNPLLNDKGNLLSTLTINGDVLNASAVIYDDTKTCIAFVETSDMGLVQSVPKPVSNYYFNSSRSQDLVQNNVNLRTDGVFSNFTPFWWPNSSGDYVKNHDNWIMIDSVILFDEHGTVVESIDKTRRRVSTSVGNFGTTKRIEAFNAASSELMWEDFELNSSPNYNSLPDINPIRISTAYSHSGKSSIEIPSKSKLEFNFPVSGGEKDCISGKRRRSGTSPGIPDEPCNCECSITIEEKLIEDPVKGNSKVCSYKIDCGPETGGSSQRLVEFVYTPESGKNVRVEAYTVGIGDGFKSINCDFIDNLQAVNIYKYCPETDIEIVCDMEIIVKLPVDSERVIPSVPNPGSGGGGRQHPPSSGSSTTDPGSEGND